MATKTREIIDLTKEDDEQQQIVRTSTIKKFITNVLMFFHSKRLADLELYDEVDTDADTDVEE